MAQKRAVKKTTAVARVVEAPKVPEVVKQREAQLPAEVSLNMQELLVRAVDKMVPVDYLQKLIDLVQAQKDRWAEEQFNKDLALAQREFPVIEKSAEARDTTKSCPACKGTGSQNGKPCEKCNGTGHPLLYRYAPYEDFVARVDPIAAKYGFSHTAESHPMKNDLGVMMQGICLIHHRDGHTKRTVVEIPIGEGTRLMSPMQRYRGAASFAIRHAYIEGYGLAAKGEDVEYPEEEPLAQPQAKGGAKTTAEGVQIETLESVKADLEKLWDQMTRKVNGKALFLNEELTEYAAFAKEHEKDLEALKNFRTDLSVVLAERKVGK